MSTNATVPDKIGLVTCATGVDQEYRLQKETTAVMLQAIGGTVDLKDAVGTYVFTIAANSPFPIEAQKIRRGMLVLNGSNGVTVQIMEIFGHPLT